MRQFFALLLLVALAAGCVKDAPLYCDEVTPCTDPDRPFCDLTGEHPGSDGHGRTCVVNPFDAGSPDAFVERQWSVPEKLANVNDPLLDEQCAVPSSDSLSLYLNRIEMSGQFFMLQVYEATRANPDTTFGAAVRSTMSDPDSFYDLELSNDGLELYHWGSLGQLRVARRASLVGAWGPFEALGVSGFTPSLAGGDLVLYFRDMSDQLMRSDRATVVDPFESASPIGLSVIDPTDVDTIDVSNDELNVLAVLDGGAPGLYLGSRSSTSEPFGGFIQIPGHDGEFSCARWNTARDEIYSVLRGVGGGFDVYVSRLE